MTKGAASMPLASTASYLHDTTQSKSPNLRTCPTMAYHQDRRSAAARYHEQEIPRWMLKVKVWREPAWSCMPVAEPAQPPRTETRY